MNEDRRPTNSASEGVGRGGWVEPVVWGACCALIASAAWGVAWTLQNTRIEWELPKSPQREASTPEGSLEVGRSPSPSPPTNVEDAGRNASKDRSRTVVNPAWEAPPEPVYPGLATLLGKTEGRARVRCVTGADGSVFGCEISEESPRGVGFGRETVRAAERASVRPRTVDGVPEQSSIEFTARFHMD
ncbi:energy transducer TonB [Brevundimonas faecalis]|uniref:energy transducer TonB n=1 Tax=Brevundimonas faecalis TaxID=947378 RepID=UPI0036176E06